jgi:hypothetical protein
MDLPDPPKHAQIEFAGDRAQSRIESTGYEFYLERKRSLMAGGNSDIEMTVKFGGGAIAELSVPATWKHQENPYAGRGTVTRLQPNDSNVPAVAVIETGAKLLDNPNKAFRQLIADNQNLSVPKPLTAREVAALADVMGMSSIGDNQYTNRHRAPDPQAPAFNLSTAFLVPLNGKTVLEVKGNFVDDSGKAVNHYRGVFMPSGSDHVTELMMESRDQQKLEAGSNNFRRVTDSIRWR